MQPNFKYYAFISYKREDEKWARWLQRKLESYRLPSVIRKDKNDLPKQLKPVFRDKTDLKTGFLKEELCKELAQSRFLIVVCSPKAAQSEWVGKEIEAFIEMGRGHCIIPFIVDGLPYTNDEATECFHHVLKENLPELLGVNINEAGEGSSRVKRERAFIRVVSKMLDVSFDTLWRRQRRRMIQNTVFGCVAILFFVSIVGFVWKANQPFDVEVRIKEVTEHNGNLPDMQNAIAIIKLDNEIKEVIINDFDGVGFINNIPAKYRGKKVSFQISANGFETLDTLLVLEKTMQMPLSRNDYYGVFYGKIRDENGNPLSSVRVNIEQFETQSDTNGNYRLEIPLQWQKTTQMLQAGKENFKIWTYNVSPGNNAIMMIKQ